MGLCPGISTVFVLKQLATGESAPVNITNRLYIGSQQKSGKSAIYAMLSTMQKRFPILFNNKCTNKKQSRSNFYKFPEFNKKILMSGYETPEISTLKKLNKNNISFQYHIHFESIGKVILKILETGILKNKENLKMKIAKSSERKCSKLNTAKGNMLCVLSVEATLNGNKKTIYISGKSSYYMTAAFASAVTMLYIEKKLENAEYGVKTTEDFSDNHLDLLVNKLKQLDIKISEENVISKEENLTFSQKILNKAWFLKFYEKIIHPVFLTYFAKEKLSYKIIYKELMQMNSHTIAEKSKYHILDLACGTAWYSRKRISENINSENINADCVDLAYNALNIAEKKFNDMGIDKNRYKIINGNAENLEFACDNKYDEIWICGALHQLPHAEPVIVEMGRVLKPGGIVYCQTFIKSDKQKMKNNQDNYISLGHGYFVEEEFKKMLAKQGIIIKKIIKHGCVANFIAEKEFKKSILQVH